MLGLASCDEKRDRFRSAWRRFRSEHISATGRVIDSANGNISHSEGQGFALLLAEAAGDYKSFAKIKAWTDYVLGIRNDSLFAWRFMPFRGRPVPDLNNATDGDILIAWALFRASRRWQKPAFAQQARRILNDIKRHCIARVADFGPLLKPGADGFETAQHLVVNPSYFVFPALTAFAAETDDDFWRDVRAAGLALLEQSKFGNFNLPADWVEINSRGTVKIAQDHTPHYGWNAIRVPLYIAWDKQVPNQPHLEPYHKLVSAYQDEAAIPAWLDLQTGEAADFKTSRGGADIYRLASCQSDNVATGTDPCRALVNAPAPQPGEDYYSSALGLLARLAYFELSPESFDNPPISQSPNGVKIAEGKSM